MDTNKSPKRRWQRTESYDQKLEQRVAKHECLRDRNNVTTCRSPGLQGEADWKSELRRKRQEEFQKRRQISNDAEPLMSGEELNQEVKVTLRANRRKVPLTHRQSLVMAQDLGITWPDISTLRQVSWITPPPLLGAGQQKKPGQTNITNRASRQHEEIPLRRDMDKGEGVQTLISSQLKLRDSGSQTECGYITIKEVDLLQLADYLQEALWREETLKHKLAFLQQSTSTLLLSCDKVWKTGCKEDLMKSKIRALESQLQVCVQKLSRDGAKRLLMQAEEQRRVEDERSLASLQRVTAEKTEAQERAAGLERALQNAQAESDRWRELYQEQKVSCAQLRTSLEQSTDQLHLLQSQLERAAGQEAALQEQLLLLQRDHSEIRHQLTVLQEDHQSRGQHLRDLTERWTSRECASMAERDQLQDTNGKQQLRGREAEGVMPELLPMEHNSQPSPTKLSQGQRETNMLGTNRRKRCHSPCFGLALLLLVAVVIFVWVHYPITRNHLQEYIQKYLQEVASAEHSKCQPI